MKIRIVIFALGAAVIHSCAVLITALYVAKSADGQAPMIWVFWMIADFPWSVALWELLPDRAVLIHGFFGSVWWFILVAFVSRWLDRIRNPI